MKAEEIDLVEIIKRSFKSLFREPGFIGLYLIPYAVVLIAFIHIWLALGTLDLGTIARTLITTWREWVVWLVAYAIVFLLLLISAEAAIILKAGARARDEFIGVGEALLRGVNYFPRLLGAGILAGLIVVGPILLLVLALLAAPGAATVAVAVGGIALWIIPAIYIFVRFVLFAQACVLDDEGCVGCLRGSWRATRGNFWLVFVMMLLFWIISFVIGLIPLVGTLAATLFVGPATIIAYTFLYLGLKKQARQSFTSATA